MAVRLLTWLLMLSLASVCAAQEPKPRFDADGDPLPPGALLRLGSARWRHDSSIGDIACTRDRKWVVSLAHDGVRVWDAATGKRNASFPSEVSNAWGNLALAPDDRRVAYWGEKAVIIRELPGGKMLHALKHPEERQSCRTFSPDGGTLATTIDKKLLLWDVGTGKLRAEIDWLAPDWAPAWAVFTPDGKALFAAHGFGTVCRVDMTAGRPEAVAWLKGEKCRGLALSPDGRTLTVCVAPPGNEDFSKQVLLLVEVASGRVLHRVPLVGSTPKLAFSADSRTLALAGDNTLRVFDAATGVQTYFENSGMSFGTPAFAPDGKTLYVADHHRIRRWSLPALKEIDPVDELVSARVLRYSPSGSVLFASGYAPSRLWDLSTGKQLHSVPMAMGDNLHAGFTPDGRSVVVSLSPRKQGEPQGVMTWDVTTGKLAQADQANRYTFIALNPDARLMASTSDRQSIEVWDRGQNRRVAFLAGPNDPNVVTYPLAFSADDRLVAVFRRGKGITLWDYSTGSHLKLDQSEQLVNRNYAEFSPDGLLLIVRDYTTQYLWDAASGHLLGQVSRYGSDMRFTRDGRGLVVSDDSEEKLGSNLKLYDLAEGKFVRDLPVGKTGCFALSPDNKTVATGQRDGTLIVWDATTFLKPLPRVVLDLPEKDLLALWVNLASDDPRKALQTRLRLTSAKGIAAFLKGRLLPDPVQSAKEIATAIVALDDDRFVVREKALLRLEQWGNLAEPGLKRALAGSPSLEARRRIQGLLEKFAAQPPGAELARSLRAVAVLESTGDADARALLHALADGAKGARRTDAARAALKRLGDL